MRQLRTIISIAVMVFLVACANDGRNNLDTQGENGEENGVGVASDNDDEADTSNRSQNDSLSIDNSANATDGQQNQNDADFVMSAADGGLLEVRLGELAKQNASSADVKDYARTMTIDHGKANDELKALANKLSIDIQNVLSEKSQQKYNELAQKKGEEFDDAYSRMMVSEHQETLEKFRAESANGQQQEIRSWAEGKIPNLQHHLEMAQKISNGDSSQGR